MTSNCNPKHPIEVITIKNDNRVTPNQRVTAPSALGTLYTLLVLAILANGLYFWLQKSQIVPSPTYQEYFQALTENYEQNGNNPPTLELEGFYAVPGAWILTKVLKDLFVLAFLIASVFYTKASDYNRYRNYYLPLGFGLLVLLAFIHSMVLHGVWVGVIGLRSVSYFAAGLLGIWAVTRQSMDLLGHFLLAVLAVELILGLIEYTYGLPLSSTEMLKNRINGTFSIPTSLGIFSVVALAFLSTRRGASKSLLLAIVVSIVYLTGSATALLLLLLVLGFWAVAAIPPLWKKQARLVLMLSAFAVLVTLPNLVGRPDIYDSLWGRVEPATDYWAHRPPLADVFFGKGLGIGANAVTSALTHSEGLEAPSQVDLFHARTDSTPLALLNQLGLLGFILFYLMLAIATWKDRSLIAVYSVLFLASLTVNILELFPVNFLMGLLFCRSFLLPQHDSD